MTVELHYQFTIKCNLDISKTCQYDTRGWDADEIIAHMAWNGWRSVVLSSEHVEIVEPNIQGQHACPECIKVVQQQAVRP